MDTPRGALFCLCTLTVLFCCAAQADEPKTSCPSLETLSPLLQEAAECGEELTGGWGSNQTAAVLDSLRTLTDLMQRSLQKTACQSSMDPCARPRLEGKGGLACVSINKTRYCKPMCNQGYDFAFLRRSRVFEQCGPPSFRWTTQYVGGSRLAICNKFPTAVAGSTWAYFPKDQDCLKTQISSALEARVIQEFLSELKVAGVKGQASNTCLLCA